ncbi:hypothetical protein GYN07_22700 [Rhizobium leguminosarum bv. viciae 248]|uniref:hypothetical protein n=1 Tax=Rhizobium leguminosarum TaxID=384 RepID=UPI0003648253|nr:hypothetical protein [Rhizobium leguminosarum]MCA2410589.1 hypothetical protein [Rhizobium leguminosarum]NKM63751.1 hypothetical protein [Rhizobium leguminosarum bv. viciae]QHW26974.1 hypothetical protein GYN07_22700 [Rhizobium leguminosarum bv. viciae 248]
MRRFSYAGIKAAAGSRLASLLLRRSPAAGGANFSGGDRPATGKHIGELPVFFEVPVLIDRRTFRTSSPIATVIKTSIARDQLTASLTTILKN